MKFVSTRGGQTVTGAEAVVKGIADDGGLFVPESFPALSRAELEEMLPMDYPERAARVLGKFFDCDGKDLLLSLRASFGAFEGEDPVPLVRIDRGLYLLELFHGPTCAADDLSFGAFSYLLRTGREELGIKEKILLLAFSADAGKAAFSAFSDSDGVKVMAIYPDDGVSKMQKLQLSTPDGENVCALAVRGTADDCRAAAEKMFSSKELKEGLLSRGYLLSSLDSNVGVLLPRVAFAVSAYLDLVSSDQLSLGETADFALPAGNFTDAAAVYYAKKMGLPVGKIIVGSNKNCALTDLFNKGIYDARRPLLRTMTPSLDLHISPAFERALFEVSGRDGSLTAERMASLLGGGRYTLRPEERKKLADDFYADFVTEDDTVDCAYEFFSEYGYPMDTHASVAMRAAERYREKEEPRPLVAVCTASPYEFPQDVLYALTGNDVKDSYKGIKRIHILTAMKVPESLKAIRYKPPRFKLAVPPDKAEGELKKFAN